MKMKTTTIEFIPAPPRWDAPADGHGWLKINGKMHRITDVHNFDDFGVERDTFTLDDGREFYSQDFGMTFQEVE